MLCAEQEILLDELLSEELAELISPEERWQLRRWKR